MVEREGGDGGCERVVMVDVRVVMVDVRVMMVDVRVVMVDVKDKF